jgi:PII-like signaling protein
MTLKGEGRLVRIFIGESDTWKGRPLYEALVHRARELGMAGATVLRGIEGFGASSVVHTTRILRLSEDLPIVIELVDTAEKVERYLTEIEEMVSEGMVTTERVEIRKYQGRDEAGS